MSTSNEKLGLFIDYEFCTGCHTCEVACKKEHKLEKGVYGIKITQFGPMEIADKKFEWDFLPIPGNHCDLCAERRSMDKLPLCVQSCQAKVMKYGPISELAEEAAKKPKSVVFSIKNA